MRGASIHLSAPLSKSASFVRLLYVVVCLPRLLKTVRLVVVSLSCTESSRVTGKEVQGVTLSLPVLKHTWCLTCTALVVLNPLRLHEEHGTPPYYASLWLHKGPGSL